MQRLALFDLDRTLIDLGLAFGLWAEELAEAHQLEADAVTWLKEIDHVTHPHREAFFSNVREHFQLSTPVLELWAEYRRRMPYLVKPYPEVLDELARLRALGWKVGIVTNGTADNQLGKLRQTGLADAVDGYAVSGVECIRKPEVGLFEIAAKRCGLSLAGGGWMVGDNLTADVEGGRNAGLRTIWVDHGTWPGVDPCADHVVNSVAEAFAHLRQ